MEASVEWGWAGAALDGYESGDLHVVVPFAGGVLAALSDGLGHGPEAAAASHAAAQVLRAHAAEAPANIMQRCHEALRGTRGAAITLASFDARDRSLAWLGIGNVDAVLLRGAALGARNEGLVMRGGIVGGHLPPLREARLQAGVGDVLIMASDGVRSGAIGAVRPHGAAQALAESLLKAHSRGSDDAHVLVVRFL